MRTLFVIFLFINSCTWIYAQQVFSRAMPFYGQLSSNEIVDLYQDQEGYIWVGTTQGLDRYDGYGLQSFKSDYRNPGLISHNGITCLSDDEHYLWIGTQRGLNLYDKMSCKIQPFPGNVFETKEIKFLMKDPKGFMWVAVGHQLYTCDSELTIVNEYDFSLLFSLDASAGRVINSVYPDRQGTIWVLTWCGGLYKYDSDKDTFERYPQIGVQNNPFSMFQDDSGHYWIATWGDGLWSFFPDRAKEQCYLKHEISNPLGGFPEPIFFSIEQDQISKHVWVLSYNKLYVLELLPSGLVRQIAMDEVVDPYKMYTKILKDRNGNFWLGSYDGAFNIFFGEEQIENYPLTGLKHHVGWDPNILHICMDQKGMIWLNQDRYGLFLYDRQSNRITYNDIGGYVRSTGINTMIPSRHQEGVWVGLKYDPHVGRMDYENGRIHTKESIELEHYFENPGNIRQLAEDREGNLWILTTVRLLVRTPQGEWASYDPVKPGALRLTTDPKGRVWAAFSDQSFSQLNYWAGAIHSKYESRFHSESAQERIQHLCMDSKGRLWFSTNLGRICRSDLLKQSFEQISLDELSPNASVLNLRSDSQSVWVVTPTQLFRYEVNSGTVKEYGTSVGNLSLSLFRDEAAFADEQGGFYVGGHGGFARIQYEEAAGRIQPETSLVITDVKVENTSILFDVDPVRKKAVNTLHQIVLYPSDRNVEIHFSSLSFLPDYKGRYAYKLDGVDQEWVYLDKGKHIAHYNYISKGKHTFHVQYMDPQGRWVQQADVLTIERLPAFYETGYAYLCICLLAGLGAYGAVRMYTLRIRKKNAIQLKEEIVQLKLDYFTKISHELLTPLTVISCGIDTLSTAHTPSSRPVIQSLHANVDRLKRLLQQILDFRKADHGKMVLRVSHGNIHSFIENLCMLHFIPLAQKKDIQLLTEMTEPHLEGFLDFDKLDKILYNLLSNAIKYTPQGRKIWMAVQTESRDLHRFLILKITDEGVGIPLQEQEHIFEPFYSAPEKHHTETNGIGLSLTKALVNLHRGTIQVKSEWGKGACFRVELPIDEASYHESDFMKAENEGIHPGRTLLSEEQNVTEVTEDSTERATVLLVEDHTELLEMMRQLFVTRYHVFVATDGLPAWELIRNQQIDVVVSDVMMPEMNGWELCRKIKSDVRFSHIPVIMLTAKNGANDRIASYEAGADGYLEKPFEREVLFARIDNLIRSRHRRQLTFRKDEHINLDGLKYNESDTRFLESIVRSIESHLQETDFDLEQLASDLHLSKSTLYRKVKSMTGLTPLDFVRNVKLKKACEMLVHSGLTISEIAYAVGFSTPKYFSRCFKEEFGMTPSEYQQKKCP